MIGCGNSCGEDTAAAGTTPSATDAAFLRSSFSGTGFGGEESFVSHPFSEAQQDAGGVGAAWPLSHPWARTTITPACASARTPINRHRRFQGMGLLLREVG
jgi:hypothetical protein